MENNGNFCHKGCQSIGEIKDLLVDNSGKIEGVVLGVGGFLGLGEHHVAVPFEQIKFVNEPRPVATTAVPATDTRTARLPSSNTPAKFQQRSRGE